MSERTSVPLAALIIRLTEAANVLFVPMAMYLGRLAAVVAAFSAAAQLARRVALASSTES